MENKNQNIVPDSMFIVNSLFMSIYLDIQEYDNRIEKMHVDLDDIIFRIQDCKNIMLTV